MADKSSNAESNDENSVQDLVEELVYKATDATAVEQAREVASRAMAPDWYGHALEVADAVSAVWEPIVRALVTALESAHQSCADDDMAPLTLHRAKAALGDEPAG